jgi:hypothetical protein
MSVKNWVKAKQASRTETLGFLTISKEATDITLLAEIPEERTANFDDGPKEQYVFAVEVDGERKLWSRTKDAPSTNELIDFLPKAPIKITVLKTGKGRNTRYTYVTADE